MTITSFKHPDGRKEIRFSHVVPDGLWIEPLKPENREEALQPKQNAPSECCRKEKVFFDLTFTYPEIEQQMEMAIGLCTGCINGWDLKDETIEIVARALSVYEQGCLEFKEPPDVVMRTVKRTESYIAFLKQLVGEVQA